MAHGTISNAFHLVGSSRAPNQYSYQFSASLLPGLDTRFSRSPNSNESYFTDPQDYVDMNIWRSDIEIAFSAFSSVGDLTFQESTSGQADISIVGIDGPLFEKEADFLIGGFAGLPNDPNIPSDVYFVDPLAQTAEIRKIIVTHEMAHTVGLKDSISTPLSEIAAEDNGRFSIMSYNEHPGLGIITHELQLYDIAALQRMYGRAESNQTDTVYQVFSQSGTDRAFAIWDSGGSDAINASYQSASALIDLRPGHFSSIGSSAGVIVSHADGVAELVSAGTHNVSIAFGAYIESASGTDFDDLIIGNRLSNQISGGKGNDVIFADGAKLGSFYDNGAGDYSQVSSTSATGIEAAPTGVIEFVDDETLQVNSISGGEGDDLIFASSGQDYISGDSGRDTVSYVNSVEAISVDFRPASSGLAGVGLSGDALGDTIDGIEVVIGTSQNDIFFGGGIGVEFHGGDGDDTFHGGGGDTLIGGGGTNTFYLYNPGDKAIGGSGVDKFYLSSTTTYSVTLSNLDEYDEIYIDGVRYNGADVSVTSRPALDANSGEQMYDEMGLLWYYDISSNSQFMDNTTVWRGYYSPDAAPIGNSYKIDQFRWKDDPDNWGSFTDDALVMIQVQTPEFTEYDDDGQIYSEFSGLDTEKYLEIHLEDFVYGSAGLSFSWFNEGYHSSTSEQTGYHGFNPEYGFNDSPTIVDASSPDYMKQFPDYFFAG